MTELPTKRGDITSILKCPICGEPIPIVFQGLTSEQDGNTTTIKASAITIKHKCKSKIPPDADVSEHRICWHVWFVVGRIWGWRTGIIIQCERCGKRETHYFQESTHA